MLTAYNLTKSLNEELSIVESTNPLTSIGNQQIDMFICLSGRGTFSGAFTKADRIKFQQQKIDRDLSEIDTSDTCRRMETTIALLRAYHRNTGKLARIFFNGVKEQNDQLRHILSTQGNYLGVPASLFIIDDIPLDNTIGQAISLRVFIERNAHMFNANGPRLVFVSSSYHVPRVLRTFGASSPLMNPEFYKSNPTVLNALDDEMKKAVLAENCLMQNAEIYVYGTDRTMLDNPGRAVDIRNDQNAVINYSAKGRPSISDVIPDNVMHYRDAIVAMSLENAKFFKAVMDNESNKCTGLRLQL